MRTAAHSRVPPPHPTRALRPILLALLVLALTHFACAPAAGQRLASALEEGSGDWREISRTDHGVLYLDTGAVAAVGEGLFEVRTRWAFARPQRDRRGRAYGSSVAVRMVDCRTGEMALLAYADHERGRPVETVEMPLFAAHWAAGSPRSPAERIVSATCAPARTPGRAVASVRP